MFNNRFFNDDELVFELELDLNLEETNLNFMTRQYLQLMQPARQASPINTPEASSVYPDLVIPDDFWESPLPSPTQWQRCHDTFLKSGYSNFPLFVKKVLYPELMQVYQMNANQVNNEKPIDESCLADLNYTVMLKLYEISENIKKYEDISKDADLNKLYGLFFKVCEDFINQYDAIFQLSVFQQSNEPEGRSLYEKFKSALYESMKAPEILDKFLFALKNALIFIDNTEELAPSDSSPASLVFSFPTARTPCLSAYLQAFGFEPEKIASEFKENTSPINNRHSYP